MKKRGSVDILQEAQSDSNSRRLSSESIAVPGVKLVGEVPIDDTDLIFNLSRLMSHPPHTVHVDMAAKKAYTMFRHLGLRHLCVVDSDFHLVGFITRKNFSRVIHDHDHPPDEEDNIDELAEGLPPPVTA
jgi:CBS domain-containing protein